MRRQRQNEEPPLLDRRAHATEAEEEAVPTLMSVTVRKPTRVPANRPIAPSARMPDLRLSDAGPTAGIPGIGLQPTLTSMRRGFASSRRGMVNFRTPSFNAASIRDVSKSSLTVNRREK